LYKEEVTTLQRLEDIEAGYSSAKAALEAAQAQYKLIEKGPREEDIRIAEATLALAETGLARARENLDDHYLSAPFDGVVSLKNLDPGAIAEMNQTVIFQLADCDRVYLDLNVSELYISKISVRMQVKVTVDALPGKDFTGSIAEINPIANTTDRSYVTRILIENEEGLLRPGMFARGHIVIKDIKQALVVPSDALHSIDGENWVLVVDETLTALRREITADGLFDGVVVVIEGLSEGENIITLSQDVQPGDKVKL
jgi:membrane fusion protein (multidrug efflux system)